MKHLLHLPASSLQMQQDRIRMADALLQELQQDPKAFAAHKPVREVSPVLQHGQYEPPRVRIYSNTFREASGPPPAARPCQHNLQGPLFRGLRQPRECSWQAAPGAAQEGEDVLHAPEQQPTAASETSRLSEPSSRPGSTKPAEATELAQPKPEGRPLSATVKQLVAEVAGIAHRKLLDEQAVRQLAEGVPDIRNKLLRMTRMLQACHAEVQRRLQKPQAQHAQQQTEPPEPSAQQPPAAAPASELTNVPPAGPSSGVDSYTVNTRVSSSQHLIPGPMQAANGAARIPTPGQGRQFVLSVPSPYPQRVRVGQQPPIVSMDLPVDNYGPRDLPLDAYEPRHLPPAHVPVTFNDIAPSLRRGAFHHRDSDDVLQLTDLPLRPSDSFCHRGTQAADADQPGIMHHLHRLENMPSSSSPMSSATAAAEFPSQPARPPIKTSLPALDSWQDDNEVAAQTLLQLCNMPATQPCSRPASKPPAKSSAKTRQRLSMVDAVVSAHFSMASSTGVTAANAPYTKKRSEPDEGAKIFSFTVPKRQRTNAAHSSPEHSSEGSGTSDHVTAAKVHGC